MIFYYFEKQPIPRTIQYDKKTGSNLITWPVAEVDNLRSNNNEFNKVVVKPGSIVPLEVGSATQVSNILSIKFQLIYIDSIH